MKSGILDLPLVRDYLEDFMELITVIPIRTMKLRWIRNFVE